MKIHSCLSEVKFVNTLSYEYYFCVLSLPKTMKILIYLTSRAFVLFFTFISRVCLGFLNMIWVRGQGSICFFQYHLFENIIFYLLHCIDFILFFWLSQETGCVGSVRISFAAHTHLPIPVSVVAFLLATDPQTLLHCVLKNMYKAHSSHLPQ